MTYLHKKLVGMLLYLRWHIAIRIMWFVVSASYRLKLWLQLPQPECPSRWVHTRTALPPGVLFLVIVPTNGINQGEAVFSQLGSSCNTRAEFRGTAGKLAIPTHTHTCLLARGGRAQCQRCLFILALGALICMPSIRLITLPHSTAPTTE